MRRAWVAFLLQLASLLAWILGCLDKGVVCFYFSSLMEWNGLDGRMDASIPNNARAEKKRGRSAADSVQRRRYGWSTVARPGPKVNCLNLLPVSPRTPFAHCFLASSLPTSSLLLALHRSSQATATRVLRLVGDGVE